ncbi:hypothetical protein MUU77_17630 [Pseudoxanthomonas sp. F37]|jgi:hypothetical protein|uniref:hypothetical protein n=1 Tax=Pseudoxanthomonas TaxID=83618 RepID=UPI001FD59DFF|nr:MULTISPECIES: hypothetical protein [Pseudoxanthomonas]UOV03600.1 hypothetical protein MUU75_10380 [Pseudoxanthomonas mexicana]UOV08597.1 hypothetical protein MUU77_17630 [Pseudoxanthomonas sp. F37]
MRTLKMKELDCVEGGEMTCTVSVGTDTSVSCTGTGADWGYAAKAVWSFLAVSPITVPGIITRVF